MNRNNAPFMTIELHSEIIAARQAIEKYRKALIGIKDVLTSRQRKAAGNAINALIDFEYVCWKCLVDHEARRSLGMKNCYRCGEPLVPEAVPS